MVIDVFLSAAAAAAQLIDSEPVRARWDQPSVLEGYTVAGLAGHLARAVLTVETYLDAAASLADSRSPEPPTTDAAGYLTTVLGSHDPLDSDFHRSVRARGTQTAADGARQLAANVDQARGRLAERLDLEGLDQPIEALDGVMLSVREYLKTRLVELVVHLDDLATSVGQPGPDGLDDRAYDVVAAVLARVAVRRAGGLATVRSLARRERQPEAVRAL